MLPWIHVSAMNDVVNMVFIDINSNWATVSQRSVVKEEEVFLRMLCNVCLENVEQPTSFIVLAAERRLMPGKLSKRSVSGVSTVFVST